MALGLAGGYGGLALIAARYLLPPVRDGVRRLFVTDSKRLSRAGTIDFEAPTGEHVLIIRKDGHIKALSSVCPHLGCTVHWEQNKNRFFCPCHNGTFTPDGTPVSGPPAKDGTPLTEYATVEQWGLVFIELPV